MKKYKVIVPVKAYQVVIVESDNETQAVNEALQILPITSFSSQKETLLRRTIIGPPLLNSDEVQSIEVLDEAIDGDLKVTSYMIESDNFYTHVSTNFDKPGEEFKCKDSSKN